MKKEWIYLALGTLVVISPWPIIALSSQPEKYPYLVAVPSDGDTIDSPVSPIFARSRNFFIVNLKDSTYEVVANKFRTEKHAVGLRIAHLLIDKQVGVVIINGHIGPEPFNNLVARRVRVYGLPEAPPATVQEAVVQYQRNALPELKRATVPTHFGI